MVFASWRRFQEARLPGLDLGLGSTAVDAVLGQGTSLAGLRSEASEGFAIANAVPAESVATEFTAFSSLFLVLRLSSSDALD